MRVARFAPEFRSNVLETSRVHTAIEDLADTFPAALFALAIRPAADAHKSELLRAIVAGMPLRELAQRLDLPWWVRKLPAEAFTAPLGALPPDCSFAVRAAHTLPIAPGHGAEWLRRVSMAYTICGSEAAIWVARQYRSGMPIATDEHFQVICAFIWHADKPDTPAGALLRKPWSAQLSVRRATEEIIAWRRRIALARHIGRGLAEPWVGDGAALGYDFVALRTVADFIAESEVMDNCLDQYATRLQSGPVRVFSVRRDGRPVADVELAAHEQETTMPAIAQVRARRNRRASADVWRAAYAWLGAQPIRPVSPTGPTRRQPSARANERAIWAPYLDVLPADLRRAFEAAVIGATPRRAVRTRVG